MANDNPSWLISKQPVVSARGVVAAQHRLAAQAGARVLAQGGNAVDAAIATALAVGVVEPWLSGIGGGGFMVVRTAKDGRVHALDFGMISARRLDPARYTLVGGQDLDWFQWPKVVDDRNINGYEAICVPGAIAGFEAALRRFGTMEWRTLVTPALALAEAGIPVDWYTSLSIAVDSSALEPFPASRAVYLPEGRAPVTRDRAAEQRLHNPALVATLQRLATIGPRDFYEGEIAHSLVDDLQAGGSAITTEDLAAYRPRFLAPATLDYRGTTLHAMPGLSGGPTYLASLAALAADPKPPRRSDPDAFMAYARAITSAYATRLATYGHAGITNDPGCTSHLSVVDAEGNMVALTNTLLSRFGAKVTLPQSGVLMNNGMMWFDPRPERPNTIAAGRRPLANMCPVVATRGGVPAFAMGAAGGRQIVPALVQLTSFLLDLGLSLQEAFHMPRLDASTGTILCNARMPADQVTALARAFPVARVEDTVYPVQFAVPNAVQHDPARQQNIGMVHITTPWPTAVAEDALS